MRGRTSFRRSILTHPGPSWSLLERDRIFAPMTDAVDREFALGAVQGPTPADNNYV